MFTTGRGISRIQPYVDGLGLQSPIITTNGAEVWKAPGELHLRRTIDPEWVIKMKQIGEREGIKHWAYSADNLWHKGIWPDEPYENFEWLKFGFYTTDSAQLDRIREEIAAWDSLEISSSNTRNVELNAKGVTKASGIREVCRILGIEMSEVIAMGDGMNDYSMIVEAGLGVAMGNGIEALKQVADFVTVTNEEDGVAKIIREYVLQA